MFQISSTFQNMSRFIDMSLHLLVFLLLFVHLNFTFWFILIQLLREHITSSKNWKSKAIMKGSDFYFTQFNFILKHLSKQRASKLRAHQTFKVNRKNLFHQKESFHNWIFCLFIFINASKIWSCNSITKNFIDFFKNKIKCKILINFDSFQ